MMKAKRKNNKGFTLVEMIIVIAVMSILAIVVSPQLISYIEKARCGTDRQAIWEVAHAAQIAYVASEDLQGADGSADNIVMVSIDSEGNAKYGEVSLSGDALDVNGLMNDPNFGFIFNDTPYGVFSNTKLDAEVNDVISADSYQYKSDLYRNSDIRITVNEDGTINILAGTINDILTDIHNVDKAKLDYDYKTTVNAALYAFGKSFTTYENAVTDLDTAITANDAELTRLENDYNTKKTEAENKGYYKRGGFLNLGYADNSKAAREARAAVTEAYGDYREFSLKWNDLAKSAAQNALKEAEEAKVLEEKYNKDDADLTAKTKNTDDLNTHINELK